MRPYQFRPAQKELRPRHKPRTGGSVGNLLSLLAQIPSWLHLLFRRHAASTGHAK